MKMNATKIQIRNRTAFTLIELLVVISIIGVLAAFTVPVIGGIQRRAKLNRATVELKAIDLAISNYKNAYGTYPPGSTNSFPAGMVNQLFYELEGTTLANNIYTNLDQSVSVTTNLVVTTFGVGGFINCTKGSGEEAAAAKNFLGSLLPNQIGDNGAGVKLLVTSVGGPLDSYQPLGPGTGVNPWRYVYPGVNNPGGYDLWVQLVIKPGQTNLICNWNNQVQINSPLP